MIVKLQSVSWDGVVIVTNVPFRRTNCKVFCPRFFYLLSSPRSAEQYFAVLLSPRSAETIFLPFYRHRAAREQYFCHFIVTAQRGNNIFAVLSSPRSAETIFLPFYRHRAARERYFSVLSSPRSVPANASATPLKSGQIIRSSGRQTRRRCWRWIGIKGGKLMKGRLR